MALWQEWVIFVVSLIAGGMWGIIGIAAGDDFLRKRRETIRRIARERELEAEGINLRNIELADLKIENRRLRERIRDYEKGDNAFGKISP